jgi:hypothetical protein
LKTGCLPFGKCEWKNILENRYAVLIIGWDPGSEALIEGLLILLFRKCGNQFQCDE